MMKSYLPSVLVLAATVLLPASAARADITGCRWLTQPTPYTCSANGKLYSAGKGQCTELTGRAPKTPPPPVPRDFFCAPGEATNPIKCALDSNLPENLKCKAEMNSKAGTAAKPGAPATVAPSVGLPGHFGSAIMISPDTSDDDVKAGASSANDD